MVPLKLNMFRLLAVRNLSGTGGATPSQMFGNPLSEATNHPNLNRLGWFFIVRKYSLSVTGFATPPQRLKTLRNTQNHPRTPDGACCPVRRVSTPSQTFGNPSQTQYHHLCPHVPKRYGRDEYPVRLLPLLFSALHGILN